jgi:ketosteroid isomerase-like protein
MRKTSTFLNQMIVLLALSALSIGFQSCNDMAKETETAGIEFNATTARTEIEAANRNFMELFSHGDSVGLANFYTIDGKFMSPEAPSVVGRANIQTELSNIFRSGITGIDIRTENVFGTEALIAEEGELTVYAGSEAVGVEKYIVLWKREDGIWKMFRDIYNSNSPIE